MARNSKKPPKLDDFWQGIVRQIVTVIVTAIVSGALAGVGGWIQGLMAGERERQHLQHELMETEDALDFSLNYYPHRD